MNDQLRIELLLIDDWYADFETDVEFCLNGIYEYFYLPEEPPEKINLVLGKQPFPESYECRVLIISVFFDPRSLVVYHNSGLDRKNLLVGTRRRLIDYAGRHSFYLGIEYDH